MLFDDTYKEIKDISRGLYKEKGSKFISYAYPLYDLISIKKQLKEIRKIEKSANHYCYAYRLHPDKSLYKFNDDGEPSYTGGKPILKQIEQYELTNILIIVVRYFGGVKLGIPGLIRSYKTAAMDAISRAQIVNKDIKEKYSVFFDPRHINDVMQIVKKYKLEIMQTEFNKECSITFLVAKRNSSIILKIFKENQHLVTIC